MPLLNIVQWIFPVMTLLVITSELPSANAVTRTDEGCDDEHEFTCKNSECIPNSARCDGEIDCADDSDEHNCACDGPDDFKCDNGDCINAEFKCDKENDCSDSSDEKNCGK